MKKIPFALVLALGLASGSAFAASSGTVTINGEIVNATCEISNGDKEKVINLVTVSKKDLIATKTAAPQTFTISLIDCEVDNVYAAFYTDAANLIDVGTHTLVNTLEGEEGGAFGVNIALFEADGTTQIKLGNPDFNAPFDKEGEKKTDGAAITTVTERSATLVYSAAYYPRLPGNVVAEDGGIKAGKVKAVANYVITYK